MSIDCSNCMALLAPAEDITVYDEDYQAAWLSVIDKQTFDSISTESGGSFLGLFDGNYNNFREHQARFFKHYSGSVDRKTAFLKIRRGVPQNADQFVECMRLCPEADLVWSITRETPEQVTAFLKWKPSPAVAGVVLNSTVVGGESSVVGAAKGEVFQAGQTFPFNGEQLVIFTRAEGKELTAIVNVTGVSREIYSPPMYNARPVSQLRVRTVTGTRKFAATDGLVELHILGRELRLDTSKDDFRPGKTDTFLLPAWNGLTDQDMRNIRCALVNRDYKKKDQGWYCEELYVAYQVGDTWVEKGGYKPGWLDDKLGDKVDRFEFIMS